MVKRIPKNWFYKGLFGLQLSGLREIKDYFLGMESKFHSDIMNLNIRYKEQVDKLDPDEEDIEYINEFYSEQLYTIEKIFVRTFRYSVVVSLYSFLESALSSLCNKLRKTKEIDLEPEDLRGEGIHRACLYLQKVCKINFPEQTHEWQEIIKLAIVRNCIVHAQGNIRQVSSKSKIENIINNSNHLALAGDTYIEVSREYMESSIELIEEFLRILHAEAFNEPN
jgi:hypothetical protein